MFTAFVVLDAKRQEQGRLSQILPCTIWNRLLLLLPRWEVRLGIISKLRKLLISTGTDSSWNWNTRRLTVRDNWSEDFSELLQQSEKAMIWHQPRVAKETRLGNLEVIPYHIDTVLFRCKSYGKRSIATAVNMITFLKIHPNIHRITSEFRKTDSWSTN